jgi:pyruvate dehydrogenase E2 component (dihydrolipoamide acetyltransferase)
VAGKPAGKKMAFRNRLMAIPITIPRLGWNMEEGIFHGWLKADGEPVRAGEMLFRLESEKATEEIECLDAGVLHIAPGGPAEGDTVAVGAVIGHLLQAGESEAPMVAAREPASVALHEPEAPARAAVVEAPSPTQSPISSPRARRVAAELGVDLTKLKGSGRNGRIRERDIRAAAPVAATGKVVPLSSVRRASAAHLEKSARSTVPVTLTTTADATNLVNLRQQFKATARADEPVPTLTDFFVKLSALRLEKDPLLAARWADDHLVLPEDIHIGIAVDTDAGLLVPVVQRAQALSLRQLAAQTRDLIERARHGKLATKDLQGGVFTITNLGMFGIDAFTPIIHYPQCAILGVGRIRRLPVFVGEKVEPRDQVTLSLTFDHRVVDGSPAARFLQALSMSIENPGPALMA